MQKFYRVDPQAERAAAATSAASDLVREYLWATSDGHPSCSGETIIVSTRNTFGRSEDRIPETPRATFRAEIGCSLRRSILRLKNFNAKVGIRRYAPAKCR